MFVMYRSIVERHSKASWCMNRKEAAIFAFDLAFGAFDINTQTLTLQNAVGVQGVLTVDNGGNLKINNSGVTTVAYVDNEFATHEYDKIDFKDSSNVVRSLIPSITGSLTYNNTALVDLTYHATQLAGKADNSRVLTDVPANALFSDTLYSHPSQHSISMITGLPARRVLLVQIGRGMSSNPDICFHVFF